MKKREVFGCFGFMLVGACCVDDLGVVFGFWVGFLFCVKETVSNFFVGFLSSFFFFV